MTQSQVRIGWRAYVDYGLDASATAFSNAAGLVDTTQRTAINTLVKDLKRFGLWSKIKAFYPFVGGSATSHKYNLVDPRDTDDAYRLTFSGGWTHNANGIKSNGSNTSANTYLNLRTVFGATSTEHNLGIYINENPVGTYGVSGFRRDINTSDGTNNIWQGVVNSTMMIFVDISSHQWYTFLLGPQSVTGLSEFKRYKDNYYCWVKNGIEVFNARSTTVTTSYNPNSNIIIGSSESSNRYATSYITSALNTIQSYLMHIAVQRFNSTLNRHIGTSISAPTPQMSYGSTPAPSLITSNLKVSLDSSTLEEPLEGALGTNGGWYHGITPGNFFLHGATWSDGSGNGNHGNFWVNNLYGGDKRSAEYFKGDSLVPEVRFRDTDTAADKIKIYQHTPSPDALITPYKGSDTGTFTVQFWVKLNSVHNYFGLTRGNDETSGGWSIQISAAVGGKVGFSAVPLSGSVTGVSNIHNGMVLSTSNINADTWYNIGFIWKPNSYVKLYVNGVLENTTSMTCSNLRASYHGWLIGGGKISQYNQRGIFGALYIYDTELTASQIVQNYESTRRKYNV